MESKPLPSVDAWRGCFFIRNILGIFFRAALLESRYNGFAFFAFVWKLRMLWIFAAIGGYGATALASVADKFLVADRIEKPAAYIFFLTIFSLVSFVLAPFGLRLFPIDTLSLFFVSGVSFAWSLLFLYRAFQIGEVSKILPLVGIFAALMAIVPSIVRSMISGEIPVTGLLAFSLLLAGAALLSVSGPEGATYSRKSVGLALLSGVFLSLFYFLLKLGEGTGANFVSGLIWSRFGVFLGGLSFLCVPAYRSDICVFAYEVILPAIRNSWRTIFFPWRREAGRLSTWTIFIGGKTLGGIGALLIIFAAYQDEASVAIVQALVGVQFAAVFLLALFLSRRFPSIFEERISSAGWALKAIAFLCISIGAWLAARGGSALF